MYMTTISRARESTAIRNHGIVDAVDRQMAVRTWAKVKDPGTFEFLMEPQAPLAVPVLAKFRISKFRISKWEARILPDRLGPSELSVNFFSNCFAMWPAYV